MRGGGVDGFKNGNFQKVQLCFKCKKIGAQKMLYKILQYDRRNFSAP